MVNSVYCLRVGFHRGHLRGWHHLFSGVWHIRYYTTLIKLHRLMRKAISQFQFFFLRQVQKVKMHLGTQYALGWLYSHLHDFQHCEQKSRPTALHQYSAKIMVWRFDQIVRVWMFQSDEFWTNDKENSRQFSLLLVVLVGINILKTDYFYWWSLLSVPGCLTYSNMKTFQMKWNVTS